MAKEKNNKSNKNFMKEFKAELKKVTWPSSKQMVNNVVTVISIVIVVSLIVFCLDLAFDGLNNLANSKLREKIISQEQVQSTENNSTSDDQENKEDVDSGNEENDSSSDSDATADTNK